MVTGLLLALLLAGCDRPGAQESPVAEPAATRKDPAQEPPAQAAKSEPKSEPAPLAFTLEVNGRPAEDGATVEADYFEPTQLRLRFPVAMDRDSVDYIRRRLPDGTTLQWEDDRTCLLLVRPGGSFAVNAEGAHSQDGTAAVKAGLVEVRRQAYTRLSLYRPDQLMAGGEGLVARWRLARHLNGIALSPDRRAALFFSSDPFGEPEPPWLVDLGTGEETAVPVPDADRWFSKGGWLPDGRIFLLGRTLWVSGPDGREWRSVATDLFSWTAQLSPDGSRIALWSPLQMEGLLVVDLKTGEKHQVKGPFRRPGADAGNSIAWSPDGQWLAGSDHDNEATGAGARIRVVDAVEQRPGRSIEGVRLTAWLQTGDLVAWRMGPEHGATGDLLLIDPSGKERKILDQWAHPSPEGKYLLLSEWNGSRSVLYLVETASGRKVETNLRHWARWTDRGEVMVLEGPMN